MESFTIEASEETPKIICNQQGKVSVKGKSLTEDPIAFYTPVLEWLSKLNVEKITLDLSLDYMNTASSKQIFTLIELAKKNKARKELVVNWYYEANDEDAIDIGKEFESLLEIPFNFIVHS